MVTAYTDEYGREYYKDPNTGKRIGKDEAYSKAGTTIDAETGRSKDIGDSGKRTSVGMFGVKGDLASAKYDVGTAASRAMFKEEAGIGLDQELKGKKFRQTRRRLAKQQRKRERIDKRASRIQQRAAGKKGKGAAQSRLRKKADRVRDKYEGPRLEDFDKASQFYEYERMEDYARASKKQQASNIAAKTIETAGKAIMGKGAKQGLDAIRGAKALKNVDEISKIDEGARTAKQARQLSRSQGLITKQAGKAADKVAKKAIKEGVEGLIDSPVTDTVIDATADATKDMSFKELFGAGKDAFKAGDVKGMFNVGKQFYDKSKPFIQAAQSIGGIASAGGGAGQPQGSPTIPAQMPMQSPMMANVSSTGYTPSGAAPAASLQIPQSLSGMSASMPSTQMQGMAGVIGATPEGNYDLSTFVNPTSMQNLYAEQGGRVKIKTNYPKQGGRTKRV